jgi:hypothetical protein
MQFPDFIVRLFGDNFTNTSGFVYPKHGVIYDVLAHWKQQIQTKTARRCAGL